MPAKKKLPWRAIITADGPAGRFTHEQIRNALIALEQERPRYKRRHRITRRSALRSIPPR